MEEKRAKSECDEGAGVYVVKGVGNILERNSGQHGLIYNHCDSKCHLRAFRVFVVQRL